MHISLICQTIAYVGRFIDNITIGLDEDSSVDQSFDVLAEQMKTQCQVSGSVQILFETFGYINLASYLFLMRHSVAHATADLKCFRIKLTVFSIGMTFFCYFCILLGPKI